jgi:hypothetical protein
VCVHPGEKFSSLEYSMSTLDCSGDGGSSGGALSDRDDGDSSLDGGGDVPLECGGDGRTPPM